jgi:hypothetical protein
VLAALVLGLLLGGTLIAIKKLRAATTSNRSRTRSPCVSRRSERAPRPIPSRQLPFCFQRLLILGDGLEERLGDLIPIRTSLEELTLLLWVRNEISASTLGMPARSGRQTVPA